MNLLRLTAYSLISSAITLSASAKVHPSMVRFHDSESDTVRITKLLLDNENISDPNQRVANIARQFIDTPYEASTLECEGPESLTVNLDGLDCTTFVENVLALAITSGEHRTSWRDFLYNLEGLRYRGGELDGYPSRLHYFSDWVVNNSHRGNIVEVTNQFPDYRSQIKTLDFMSKNAGKYPALADSTTLADVKNFEMGYRKHQYPYIPWNNVASKAVREKFKDGDVIAILTKAPGLDVSHMGFIIKDDKGQPHLLHASSKEGKVILDNQPLMEYLKKNGSPGIRVIRLPQN